MRVYCGVCRCLSCVAVAHCRWHHLLLLATVGCVVACSYAVFGDFWVVVSLLPFCCCLHFSALFLEMVLLVAVLLLFFFFLMFVIVAVVVFVVVVVGALARKQPQT